MEVTLPLSKLFLSLVAGSLTTLSPCVFPLLPLVLGGAIQGNRFAPMAMGFGMVFSFAMLGMVLGALGPVLGLHPDGIRQFAAFLLLGFGVVMLVPAFDQRFAGLMSPLASSANQASARLNNRALGGAFLLGMLLGLIWSPCSGPLLASAIALVVSDGGIWQGTLILGLFGLGAAIPLVVVAYASRHGVNRFRGWLMIHISLIKKVFSTIIILVAIAILTGADKWLETKVLDLLPDRWIELSVLF